MLKMFVEQRLKAVRQIHKARSKGKEDEEGLRDLRTVRQLDPPSSMSATKLKPLLLLLMAAVLAVCLMILCPVEAGYWTFYFPNIFKPRGFNELNDMLHSLDAQINETRDNFADIQYFWGQMERLDSVAGGYPEESACSEVFPLFMRKAINYIYIDFEHYIKPFELYKEHLLECRNNWYPAGLESKAALPRKWEQGLFQKELELKIEWLDRLVNSESYKLKRQELVEIWKNVRRGLDTSLPCIYLRYAYQRIAEDINQVALESNLEGMKGAMVVLENAFKRISVYKKSDQKVIKDIEEELEKVRRFTIKGAR